ncbi:hypothetical protein TREMEDRAFT_63666 [Tremella mesenterica DSM 1558]|uniref:uncharacterized protein n=1 Tax=Tremella mesenterica (strain ATCC 24925 / CBS 8224 / DSM 1558 / NBRC 9311 / NRRL Y-6157 / RJB 2259-6 / UBC 559-6) TaxID=578456 RepID=UPI0003F4949B|nr:uncharacterized protein TREMEDRAFT_63666 [Tremella mesenterica DSM 1558]EIW68494.1 hypothetical protein TREMEDRAFT_63666 [Tremella mesenterica DSM 1558]
MTDHQAILDEEFEVLESIFPPEEIQRKNERCMAILVTPDESSSSHSLSIYIIVNYPPDYPDVIPLFSLEPEDGIPLDTEEEEKLLGILKQVAEESVGMAMTFTLVSAIKESLMELIHERIRREKEEDDRRAREYEEVEAKKTRGTPLTRETFEQWRKGYMSELKIKREKEEEERVRGLPPKEREEWKRRKERPTGKTLFEVGGAMEDIKLYEEESNEVDLTQYTREERERQRLEEEEEEEKRRDGLVRGDESD